MQATINKILTFSCVDGPGNRLVIFFQGCNFQCLNCHNPYTVNNCNHCGDCVETCPENALFINNQGKVQWRKDLCTHCDKCLETCTYSASPKTNQYTVSEIIDLIRQNRPFISGITLSGGEATVQLPFILELLKSIRSDPTLSDISCLLDTNGSIGEASWRKILPLIDGAMLDIKSWGNENHIMLTGSNNLKVKRSLSLLMEENKLTEIRLLVIPERSDYQQHIESLAKSLKLIPSSTNIRINAFHTHGVRGPASNWNGATRNDIEKFATQLRSHGINQLILPSVYLDEI